MPAGNLESEGGISSEGALSQRAFFVSFRSLRASRLFGQGLQAIDTNLHGSRATGLPLGNMPTDDRGGVAARLKLKCRGQKLVHQHACAMLYRPDRGDSRAGGAARGLIAAL